MLVTDLKSLHSTYAELFNNGDACGLASLYGGDAVFVPQPGVELRGAEAIRAAIQGFLGTGFKMTMTTVFVLDSGDLALLSGEWKLTDNGQTAMSGKSSEVVRRGSDGGWRYVIDNPFSA